MSQYINLSHNDLDGAMCNVVLRSRYPDMETIHSNYNDIIENLQIIDESLSHLKKALFITDLNFNVPSFLELAKLAVHNPDLKIIYIDHHPYEDEVGEIFEKIKKLPNVTVVHEIGKSATKLCYETIRSDDKALGKIVDYTNAFDIWLRDSEPKNFKGGWFLNTMFWELKMSGFKANIIKSKYEIPSFFKKMFKEIVAEKDAYIDKMIKRNTIIFDDENSVCIAISDKYKAWFQEDFPQYLVHILPYETKNNISVRISHKVSYAKEMKEEMVNFIQSYPHTISCGGHDHAFGSAIEPSAPRDDIFMLAEGLATIAGDYLKKNS